MRRKIPNILSIFRAVLAPLFFVWLVSGKPKFIVLSLIAFTIGAVSDFFDGYIARKLKVTSEWGAFFDPLADKLLTTAAFIAFAVLKFAPWWMVTIIFLRDIGTTVLRVFKVGDKSLKTSSTAKMKTTIQMIFIFFILIAYSASQYLDSSISLRINDLLHSSAVYFSMLLITILTVWSMLEYLFVMFKSEAK